VLGHQPGSGSHRVTGGLHRDHDVRAGNGDRFRRDLFHQSQVSEFIQRLYQRHARAPIVHGFHKRGSSVGAQRVQA